MEANKRQQTLSRLMIVALIEAYTIQKQNIPYGPADIKGSIYSLIRRGLLVHKNVALKDDSQSWWQLTSEAINILQSLGVDVVD